MPPKKAKKIKQAKSDDTTAPIFFYQEKDEYGFMSQWYMKEFKSDESDKDGGAVYNCAEQYMMHHKALLFNDAAAAAEVMSAHKPGDQKSLGRKVANWDDEVWNLHREKVVENGNYYKFSQSPHLKKMLLDTGDRELVEAARHDKVWGIGYRAHEAVGRRRNWGLNLLGKCIMRVRERLREEMRVAKVED